MWYTWQGMFVNSSLISSKKNWLSSKKNCSSFLRSSNMKLDSTFRRGYLENEDRIPKTGDPLSSCARVRVPARPRPTCAHVRKEKRSDSRSSLSKTQQPSPTHATSPASATAPGSTRHPADLLLVRAAPYTTAPHYYLDPNLTIDDKHYARTNLTKRPPPPKKKKKEGK